jgi:hypothetical protein
VRSGGCSRRAGHLMWVRNRREVYIIYWKRTGHVVGVVVYLNVQIVHFGVPYMHLIRRLVQCVERMREIRVEGVLLGFVGFGALVLFRLGQKVGRYEVLQKVLVKYIF